MTDNSNSEWRSADNEGKTWSVYRWKDNRIIHLMNKSNKMISMFEGKKKKEEYDPKDKFSSNIDPEQLKAAQKFAKNAKKK